MTTFTLGLPFATAHRHIGRQHEELGQELHGAVRRDTRHRRQAIAGALEIGVRRGQRHGLRREERDPALEVAGIHHDVIGHHREMRRTGRERLEPVAFAGPLDDPRGDASRHGPQLEHRRRGGHPDHERHACRIPAEHLRSTFEKDWANAAPF